MFFDWNKISEELTESMDQLSDTLTCEIKCNDFSYSGLCIDKEEVFNFMINQSICGVSN